MQIRCSGLLLLAANAVSVRPAGATCEIPPHIAKDPEAIAAHVFSRDSLLVDGHMQVLPRGDGTTFWRITVNQYLKGKGPKIIDVFPLKTRKRPSAVRTPLATSNPPRQAKPADAVATGVADRTTRRQRSLNVFALRETPLGYRPGHCFSDVLHTPGVATALRSGIWMVTGDERFELLGRIAAERARSEQAN